jgi:hypothetical protein
MAEPLRNPSPRQKFQADKDLMNRHLDLIGRDDVRAMLETARAQVNWKLCQTLEGAASFHLMQVGIHEFLDTFYLLSAVAAPPKTRDRGNLVPTD